MGKSRVEARITIRAKIEDVFEQLIDHEAMASWPGIGACTLVEEGTPRNGLGAVRRVRVGGLTIDEKVVLYDPPHAFDYAIIRGVPVNDHLGEVRFSETDGRVEVVWNIRISSRWPFVAAIMASQLRRGIPRALRFVAKRLEG
ncbi:MAG: SRPBCC family protein [Polyangiaceae bacterium]